MKDRRLILVYALLALLWAGVGYWQYRSHLAAGDQARMALRNRVQEIAKTLSIVIRSQDFPGSVARRRLEAALKELVTSTEIQTVMLLNSAGEVTATFGQPINTPTAPLLQSRELWLPQRVIFVTPVALGQLAEPPAAAGQPQQNADKNPAPEHKDNHAAGNRNPAEADHFRGNFKRPHFPIRWDNIMVADAREKLKKICNDQPFDDDRLAELFACFKPGVLTPDDQSLFRQILKSKTLSLQKVVDIVNLICLVKADTAKAPVPNMADFRELIKKQGIHWCVIMMPAATIAETIREDRKIRFLITGIALLAAIAAGVAARTLLRSFHLRLRFTRARDAANYLKDQNMAAVGLVHETKNPLNLIRGQAQIIAMSAGVDEAVRDTAVRLLDEVDRVTGRLTQFLDYSKPSKPQLDQVSLIPLLDELFALLDGDCADKNIRLRREGPDAVVAADREMLRQLLFNLLLNAIQAVVPDRGEIVVTLTLLPAGVRLDIADNGPGIAPDLRDEIFRPYFTTNAAGTGLGLSIVKKIALAHNWEILLTDAVPGHTVFTLRGLRLYSSPGENAP